MVDEEEDDIFRVESPDNINGNILDFYNVLETGG